VKVRPGGRRWIVVGLAVAAVVLAATVVLLVRESRPAVPPEATAAVDALLNGTPDQIRAALSPPLDSELAAPSDQPAASAVAFELSDWQSDGVFAGATATVHTPGRDVPIDVGFRLVNGTWRITFAQPRAS
jgi:hypothetical protein